MHIGVYAYVYEHISIYVRTCMVILNKKEKKDHFLSAREESCISFRQDLVTAEKTGKCFFFFFFCFFFFFLS